MSGPLWSASIRGPCQLVARDPADHHHIVYEDSSAIAFLNKYPILYGYTLVALRVHREHVTGVFTADDYLALQRVVYRVAEAVRHDVPIERVSILLPGSQQGNRHVHWPIVQQLEALRVEQGVLPLTDDEISAPAHRIDGDERRCEPRHLTHRPMAAVPSQRRRPRRERERPAVLHARGSVDHPPPHRRPGGRRVRVASAEGTRVAGEGPAARPQEPLLPARGTLDALRAD